MVKQYEFRLLDMSAADGQIDADRLIELVQSLKDLALRVGRSATGSGSLGRPAKRLDRLARLSIGLSGGSTRLQFARSADVDALQLEAPEEDAFDGRFREVVESVAQDMRPEWVNDLVAGGAAALVASLQRSAPRVELSVDGVTVRSFRPGDLHGDTWAPRGRDSEPDPVIITGVLDRVDLRSHRFRVRDDVGFDYALPEVADATAAGRLIGSRVRVTGWARRDQRGRVTQVTGASVATMADESFAEGVQPAVPLAAILATAPGPQVGALGELSAEESETFLEAMGL